MENMCFYKEMVEMQINSTSRLYNSPLVYYLKFCSGTIATSDDISFLDFMGRWNRSRRIDGRLTGWKDSR